MIRRLSRFLIQHAGWVVLISTLLGGVGAVFTVELYKNLRPDIEELLPSTARSVIDLNEVTSRLKSIDNLAVLLFSADPAKNRQNVDRLAAEFQKISPELLSSVEFRIAQEIDFFSKRKALFLETDDLAKIRNFIEARIEYEKSLYNPLNLFLLKELPEPKFDFARLESKYSGRTLSYSQLPDGYYATPDFKRAMILVYGTSQSITVAQKLREAVDAAIARVEPTKLDPSLQLHFSGNIQDLLEEQAALLSDLALSTILTVLVVFLGLVLYYRSIRGTLALLYALFIGTFWTFGISYFLVGFLNANSAFMGPIVIGNGINFGIIYLARYLEERRRGQDSCRAVHRSILHTYRPTLVAALAAGLSYGSLMLTSFRGFKQFGLIGLIGMILCWIAAYLLIPTQLVLLERWKPLVKRHAKRSQQFSEWMANLTRILFRHPAVIWTLSLLLTLGALQAAFKGTDAILETDLTKLRDKVSLASGSGYFTRYVDEILGHYSSPIAILGRERDQTRKIGQKLKEMRAEDLRSTGKSLIASVQTVDDFVPEHQEERIKILHEIQKLLPPKLLKELSSADRQKVHTFLAPEVQKSFNETDLPGILKEKFTEKNGKFGNLVLVEPPLSGETREGGNLIRFVKQLREAADSVAPGTPVAGRLPVSADMIEAIKIDGPKATLLAFSSVILLVILLFRNLSSIFTVLSGLLLGVLWMVGVIFALDWKVNFLNFVALPITFGIGVDYGVNIFQRYQLEGSAQILRVIQKTGGAVLMASFTTIVGYGSLLIAGNQAFVSLGRLAVLGEVTCVLAAVVALPAFIMVRERRASRGKA